MWKCQKCRKLLKHCRIGLCRDCEKKTGFHMLRADKEQPPLTPYER
jgi:hypothetical protein